MDIGGESDAWRAFRKAEEAGLLRGITVERWEKNYSVNGLDNAAVDTNVPFDIHISYDELEF